MLDQEIKQFIFDNGIEITNNPNEAIYILRDGTMIGGEFYDGIRGIDHRNFAEAIISEYDRYSKNMLLWKTLHEKLGVLMLVPETKMGMIMQNQVLTSAQKNILQKLNYQLEEYC